MQRMSLTGTKILATQIVSIKKEELRIARLRVAELEADLAAAERLAGDRVDTLEDGRAAELAAIDHQSSITDVRYRAKNAADLTYDYIREHSREGGLSAMEIYHGLVAAGSPIGAKKYIYFVLSKLAADGLVRKDAEGRYTLIALTNPKNSGRHK
ncbi:MAG TPA: hypothetical protein VFE08_14130 [Candidatus Sulfotelmatobacter sp.]|nr:hypothetical protein [Candidatus Sulfotelmatobacter sp.]